MFYVQTLWKHRSYKSCYCHKADPMSSQNMATVSSGYFILLVLLCCISQFISYSVNPLCRILLKMEDDTGGGQGLPQGSNDSSGGKSELAVPATTFMSIEGNHFSYRLQHAIVVGFSSNNKSFFLTQSNIFS